MFDILLDIFDDQCVFVKFVCQVIFDFGYVD